MASRSSRSGDAGRQAHDGSADCAGAWTHGTERTQNPANDNFDVGGDAVTVVRLIEAIARRVAREEISLLSSAQSATSEDFEASGDRPLTTAEAAAYVGYRSSAGIRKAH